MEFEAAIGCWQDGFMSASITLDRTEVTYSTYRLLGYQGDVPKYEQSSKRKVTRRVATPVEKAEVQAFFDWMLEHMRLARDYYPSEPRFARGSKIGGVNWSFILWMDGDETYNTGGRSGTPAWWEEACDRISAIVDSPGDVSVK